MNVAENDRYAKYTATDLQTDFIFDWPIYETTSMVVLQNEVELNNGVDYTLTAGDGGTVVLTTPASEDDLIILYSGSPESRTTQFTGTEVDVTAANVSDNYLTFQTQQLRRDVGRCIKNSLSDGQMNEDLPEIDDRKGLTAIWDDDGNLSYGLSAGISGDSFLKKSENLSDLDSISDARDNLSVYSKAEVDALDGAFLEKSANLSDVADASISRDNLGLGDVAVLDQVSTPYITDNAILTVKIKDLNVTEAKLEDNAITNVKMADDAIGIPELSATGTPSASTYLRGDNVWSTSGVEDALLIANNLSDLADVPMSRTNLDVYSKGEVDTLDGAFLAKTSNLSDLDNAATSRTNLGLGSLSVLNTVGASEIDDNAITNIKMADDAIGIAELSATGTPDATTYLRGDNTWTATPTDDPLALKIANNLSDVADVPTSRTNLDIYSKGEGDARYLLETNNLSDLTDASVARTNLGLGTIATQDASSVAITGGSIIGISDLSISDGGTGASTAADARTNLDVYSKGEVDTLDGAFLVKANNLSGLTNVTTARTNLGLGDLAVLNTVGTTEIDNLSVTEAKLATDAVTNAKVADDAIGIAELSATGTPSASNYLRGDNTWTATPTSDPTALKIANNLSDLANAATARTNLNVYSTGQGDARYLVEANNLSDLTDTSIARTNLNVYSKGQGDAQYLVENNNLSDLPDTSIARTNLDVYSKGQGDAQYLVENNNLSDLNDAPTARANLGLGTIATQDASNVSISGGSITGITLSLFSPLSIASGGTGATNVSDARANLGLGDLAVLNQVDTSEIVDNAITNVKMADDAIGISELSATGVAGSGNYLRGDNTWSTISSDDPLALKIANNLSDLSDISIARTNLGLGTIATQDAVSVSITGGSITGITDISIADGGTGSSTAADARTNLDVYSKGEVDTLDGAFLVKANNLSGLTNITTARTNLGVAIGTDVQAYDATLQSLSGLGTVADRVAYTTAIDTWAETPITAAGRSLMDDASAAAQRTTLGLGVLAIENTVSTALIDDNAITNIKMADDAIGLAELSATGTPSASNYLRGDNTWAAATADDPLALKIANNLSDLANAATARTNLNVYSTGQGDARYLVENNNLSDLPDTSIARTNLNVYSKGQGDARYLVEANNLSDLTDTSIARTNLNVYSKGQGDAQYLVEVNNLSDLNDAPTARANLGLGTIATQDASNVSISGGSITGITLSLSSPLSIASGGTGATNVSDARANLDVYSKSEVDTLDGAFLTKANNLSDLTNVTTARTNLGLGNLAVLNTVGTSEIDNNAITNVKMADDAVGIAELSATGVAGSGNYLRGDNTWTAISSGEVSGLGTMATQDADSVIITGGSVTGITDLAVADGGTGASDSATARANLDIYSKSEADAKFLDEANNLSDLDNITTARTNLGVAIGTDVQAYDATLQSLSGLGTVADKMAYTTAIDTWAETDITSAGRALIDDADASAQRTTLGLGDLAVLNTVDTAQIVDDAVTSTKIADYTILNTNIANGTINSTNICNYTITNFDLGGNCVDNRTMADDAIGLAELSATGTPSASNYLRGDNTWATISSVGFAASVTSDKTISASTDTTIYPYTEKFDLGGDFNATWGFFSAPTDGLYHFSASMLFDNATWSDEDRVLLYLYDYSSNRATIARRQLDAGSTSGYNMSICGSVTIELDDGDQIALRVNQNSSSSKILSGTTTYLFTGHLVV